MQKKTCEFNNVRMFFISIHDTNGNFFRWTQAWTYRNNKGKFNLKSKRNSIKAEYTLEKFCVVYKKNLIQDIQYRVYGEFLKNILFLIQGIRKILYPEEIQYTYTIVMQEKFNKGNI